jgi:hypothetical protein
MSVLKSFWRDILLLCLLALAMVALCLSIIGLHGLTGPSPVKPSAASR